MNIPYKNTTKSVRSLLKGKLPYNPEGRELKDLHKLCESIEKHGLLEPIKVSGNKVGDGHRRLAAVNKLGWQKVPVQDYGKNFTAEELFCLCNDRDTRKEITGAQALLAFVMGGYRIERLPGNHRKNAKAMFESLHRTTIKQMSEMGLSFQFFLDVRQAVRKISKPTRWSNDFDAAVRQLMFNQNKQALKQLHSTPGLSAVKYDEKAIALLEAV